MCGGVRARGRPAPALPPIRPPPHRARPSCAPQGPGVGAPGAQTCARSRPEEGVSVRRGGALGGCRPAPDEARAHHFSHERLRGVSPRPLESPRPAPRQQRRRVAVPRVARCPARRSSLRAHGPSVPAAARSRVRGPWRRASPDPKIPASSTREARRVEPPGARRSGRRKPAGRAGAPERRSGARARAPRALKRPSAGELAAAACPETPLTGLGNGLPWGRPKTSGANDARAPLLPSRPLCFPNIPVIIWVVFLF